MTRVESNSLDFDTLTTGNFMGFDVWLEGDLAGGLEVACNWGDIALKLADLG